MNHPNIIAVGSSPLVAKEIADMLVSILHPFPELVQRIAAQTTAAVTIEPDADTFYVCANTQGSILAEKIPPKQLFILELQPTTRFFLDIAKIPSGEDVYVFNNLMPYIQLLTQECRELGITKLHFHPLAFEEMPAAKIEQGLKQAKWLVGVAPFVGKDVLFSGHYQKYLRPELTVIAGHRMASVASASRLLAAIAHFYRQELQKEQTVLMPSDNSSQLAEEMLLLTHRLQEASLEIIKQQISGPSFRTDFSDSLPVQEESPDIPSHLPDIHESSRKLDYLIQRIGQLASSPSK